MLICLCQITVNMIEFSICAAEANTNMIEFRYLMIFPLNSAIPPKHRKTLQQIQSTTLSIARVLIIFEDIVGVFVFVYF